MLDPVLLLILAAGLIVGSYTDLRVREVPDWVNFAMIAGALGVRLVYSAAFWDFRFILQGLAGFVIFFAISWVMFYTGQWGGGDSKMLMAIGAILGLELSADALVLSFVANTILVSAAYGLLWSIGLAATNWKSFLPQAKALCSRKGSVILHRSIWVVALAVLAAAFAVSNARLKMSFLTLSAVLVLTFYTWIMIKSVEDSCMLKRVPATELTEGDWISEDVIVKGKLVCGPADLGVSKSQIRKLRRLEKDGLIDSVPIKVGIPFVPCFLFSMMLTLAYGNIILLLIL